MYTRSNPPTQDEVLEFYTKLSNWGRWGADDELGTLNLISPQVRRRAGAAVRHGISVSCSWDIPVGAGGVERTMNVRKYKSEAVRNPSYPSSYYEDKHFGGSSEHLAFKTHEAWITHIDALCHEFWDGKLYNDRPAEVVDATQGAGFGAISAAAAAMVTRGVLLDIAGLRGVDWLEVDDPVFPEDLEAAEERQGVRVEAGDAILLRTGTDLRRRQTGRPHFDGSTGWHAACLPWLSERDVAYIGCDTGTEIVPSGYPGIFAPVHTCGLVAMGLWLIDHCDLAACARTAEELRQWDFLLSVAPIRFPGSSGSPVNPIATF